MPLIQSLVERRGSPENPRNGFEAVFEAMDYGALTNAGKRINETTAMNLSAVYAAVRVHTDTVASVPLLTYRRLDGGGKERAFDHRVYELLHLRPNPLMTSFSFREALQSHLSLWGNAFAEIEYDNSRRPIALWPLLPDRTRVVLVDNRKVVVTKLNNGKEQSIPGERVLHVPGFGYDGIIGKSIIAMARESLAVGAAAEEYGARFFGQGARAAGFVSHPAVLSKAAADNIKKSLADYHGGLANSHRIGLLEEGMSFTSTSIPPEDSQFLETRQFSVTEVARWFKVKPHKIADLSRATFSNIEAENISSYQDTALPWFVRWEQALQLALLTERERETMLIEFQADGILRGDTAARGEFYTKLFNIGATSPNEIREKENMNPVEGGDQRFVGLNMVPLTAAESLALSDGRSHQGRREQRTMEWRVRQRDIQRPLFRTVAAKVLTREIKAVRREIGKAFSDRAKRDFSQWLERFYDTFNATVSREFRASLLAYALSVLDSTSEGVEAVNTGKFNGFVDDYVQTLGKRWAARSRRQLAAILEETPAEDVVETLEQRLDEWDEKRPDKVAQEEAVRGGEAFARAALVAIGITTFRWVTRGENCPLCQPLNGRVVGRDGHFLDEGETVQGGEKELTTRSRVLHPPLHDGCDCMVIGG